MNWSDYVPKIHLKIQKFASFEMASYIGIILWQRKWCSKKKKKEKQARDVFPKNTQFPFNCFPNNTQFPFKCFPTISDTSWNTTMNLL